MNLLSKRDRSTVASVFSDEDVKKIWFHLGDLGIEGKNLGVVGELIRGGKITCYENVSAAVLKKRDAEYNLPHNTLFLGSQIRVRRMNTLMESLVLHEGVHAYIDHKKLSGTTVLHNEAAAYVTQALFLRAKGQPWPRAVRADPLIRALESLVDRFTMYRNKAWLNWAHFEPLMKAIQAHPAYLMRGRLKIPWNTRTPADGVACAGDGLLQRSTGTQVGRGPLGAGAGGRGGGIRARGPVGVA